MQNHTIVFVQNYAELLLCCFFNLFLSATCVGNLKQLISAVIMTRTGQAYQCARKSGTVRHSLSPNLVNEYKPNLTHDTFE